MVESPKAFQRSSLNLSSVMDKESAPSVTVLTAAYNGELHLREAIESILLQTFTDFEFIIIDDGSTDGTWDILNEYAERDQRIFLVHNEENLGLAKSLNKGLALARGKYVARQDGDDVSLPERLAIQVEYLEACAAVGLLGTAYYVVNSGEMYGTSHRQPTTDTEIRWKMLFDNPFCHTSVMLRRDLLANDRLRYDETLPFSQDYEFWCRILQCTSAANLETPLVMWRKSDNAISTTHRGEQQRIATIISAEQVNRLLPHGHVTFKEMERLRRWFNGFPPRIAEENLQSCRQLLQILTAFSEQSSIDSATAIRITMKWISLVVSALGPIRNWNRNTAGVLATMLHIYAKASLFHFYKLYERHQP